jgi:hypothetical protein
MLSLAASLGWADPPEGSPLHAPSDEPARAVEPVCRIPGELGYDLQYRHDTAREEMHGWMYQSIVPPGCVRPHAAVCTMLPALEKCLATTPARELEVSVALVEDHLVLTGPTTPATLACLAEVAPVVDRIRTSCWFNVGLTTLPLRGLAPSPVPGGTTPRP